MQHWFALPQSDDEYLQFSARVLHYTLLILIGIALVFTPFASSPSQLLFIPILVLLLGGCYYLLHTWRFRLASILFVSGMWLIITIASFSLNGIRNASMSTYAIVIIFAAVLFQFRAVIVFTTLSVASATILLVGETLNVLPLRTTPLYLADRFFQQIALFSSTGILLFAAARVIRSSFDRIHNNEETLLERNRELENEITERQRIESDLRLSEEKYRLLFENSSNMAALYGPDGKVILMNKAAAQFMSMSAEAFQGRTMHDIFPAEYAERSMQQNIQVMETGKASLVESQITLEDGNEFYYLRHVMPLPAAGEIKPSLLVITTDITEQNIAQQRENDLILAQEKNAFLTEFFGTVSHDLKTPLTVMNTSLYLLERVRSDEQRKEKITRISEQVSLMDRYIQDMLTISRLEHLPSLNFQAFNLNQLIADVIHLLRPKIETQKLSFTFNAAPDLPLIPCDQEQIQRLLTNLIENAINYTPPTGAVNVDTHSCDEWVILRVKDSGIGIEPNAIPHIFERFYRTANARAFTRSGTGLGLAIVKKIVETHSATIEVESQPAHGTTFRIQFPKERPC